MAHSAYPLARDAALRILPRLPQNLMAGSLQLKSNVATLPPNGLLEEMIDAVFWASLRREEGFTPKISVAFVAAQQTPSPMTFNRPLPVHAHALTKLAPAVERPGIHLGVWTDEDGKLQVWGTTRALPSLCLVLEVVAPGLLVIKHSKGEDSGKFVNLAVIEGEQIKVIDQSSALTPDCPDLLTSLLGIDSQFSSAGSTNVLIQLAVSIRAHGRGGSLLVVPANSPDWSDSILRPITYAVDPAFAGLSNLMQVDPYERPRSRWQAALREAVEAIGGLTAVDGATVVTTQHEVLAFGAKIVRRPGWAQVEKVVLTEPIEEAIPVVTEPSKLGGTRHLSAAQFAHDQRDAIALVASQDGRFTVFGWSPCEEMVHAHRIEALLL